MSAIPSAGDKHECPECEESFERMEDAGDIPCMNDTCEVGEFTEYGDVVWRMD